METGELTYDDFLSRLSIQDVLLDAGYHVNRRDGLRYPSYVRLDSEGCRVRGDKFIVTRNGQCCFQPPHQKLYNVISFIKAHPHLFAEYRAGMQPDRLVNLVCNRLLNHPVAERETKIVRPRQEAQPFDIANYAVHRFNPQDRDSQKKFYSFFRNRGIDLYTQYAFHRHFCLAAKHREDGMKYTNLAFPMTLPEDAEKVVGLEERGRPAADGSSTFKGKAEGSNSSAGLWIASPARTPLAEAADVYWFESAYDAMAYYQLHQKQNRELRKAVFISTGGNPTKEQMRGVLTRSLAAKQHICFDSDTAGLLFSDNLKEELYRAVRATVEPTLENQPYLDTVKEGRNLDWGDIDLLPEALQRSYGRYESAYEEAMSMRSSGLCHPDDIQEQVNEMEKHYKVFRGQLREFLGLEAKNDTSCIRELPAGPCKDWNEQLLSEMKMQASAGEQQEAEQEHQTRFHR